MLWLCLRIAVISCIFSYKTATGFVKLLLKSPPIMEKNNIWSRPIPQTAIYGNLSLALWRSLKVSTPSYVQILTKGILSVTSFSLLRKGSIMQFNLENTSKSSTLRGDYLWPNELSSFKDCKGQETLLVPDGFLLPGQNDGGLYAITNPHTRNARPVRLTSQKRGWFYHRATHVRLPCGREGIITARANKPILGPGRGELVWLSRPPPPGGNCGTMAGDGCFLGGSAATMRPQSSAATGSTTTTTTVPLNHSTTWADIDMDPSSWAEPWIETVLAEGPDVMFEVLDLDSSDDYIEIVSAHFFGEKLSVHSIRGTEHYPYVVVEKTATLDTLGQPYGISLATMTAASAESAMPPATQFQPHSSSSPGSGLGLELGSLGSLGSGGSLTDPCCCDNSAPTHLLVTTHECSYDVWGTLSMAVAALTGKYPRVITGASARLREGESSPVEARAVSGGSLFAYELPKRQSRSASYLEEKAGPSSISITRDGFPIKQNSTAVESGSEIDIGLNRFSSERVVSYIPDNIEETHLNRINTLVPPASSSGDNQIAVSREEGDTELGASVAGPSAASLLGSQFRHRDLARTIRRDMLAVSSAAAALIGIASNSVQLSRKEKNAAAVEKVANSASSTALATEVEVRLRPELGVEVGVGVGVDLEKRARGLSQSLVRGVSIEEYAAEGRRTTTVVPSPLTPIRLDWERHTLFRGFRVRGWGGIFAPGAPGFPYVFRMPNKPQAPPLILLAGDCTGSAYVFAPSKLTHHLGKRPPGDIPGDVGVAGSRSGERWSSDGEGPRSLPSYELAFEVECGATVGSAAVAAATDGSGDVDIYIPSYELNQIHVLRLSDDAM